MVPAALGSTVCGAAGAPVVTTLGFTGARAAADGLCAGVAARPWPRSEPGGG
jgi:hypothetical protein